MKFIFVRHAQTLFNVIGLTQGWADSPLTELGYTQTEELENILQDMPVDVIYSSPTPRAHTTASILNKNRKLIINDDERLKEINFGVTEGMPTAQRDLLHIEDKAWPYTMDMNYEPYQGEDIKKVVARQMQLINECINTYDDHSTIMMVGHGCSLYALMRTLVGKQLDEEYPNLRFIHNSSAVMIDYKNGQYTLTHMTNPVLK